MNKHIGFAVSEEIHSKMKVYLKSFDKKKTIKEYMTELLVKDLENKEVQANKEEE